VTLSFVHTKDGQTGAQHGLDVLEQYRQVGTYFLFDKPKSPFRGGWLDFAIAKLKSIEDELGDYFFAGGLNASNINTVLQKLRPAVLDIASGVEQTARQKNRKRMTEFFGALGIHY
jgi:phosphoribosylanthranilate isomerase